MVVLVVLTLLAFLSVSRIINQVSEVNVNIKHTFYFTQIARVTTL